MTTPHKRKAGRPPLSSQAVPTKERILKATANLFLSHGFDAVTSQRVAEECGVTKAMVYYYFSSKTNLVTTAIIQLMEQIKNRTTDLLKEPGSFYERMLKIATTRLKVDTKIDMSILLHDTKSSFTAEQMQTIQLAEQRLMDTLAQSFEEAAASGEIKSVDGQLAARLYSALLNASRSKEFAHIPADERAKKLLDIMWFGIQTSNA